MNIMFGNERYDRNNLNSKIIKAIGLKPIAYNVALAYIADNVYAGLFMSQLLYWHNKGSNPNFVYKTIQELQKETWLSRSQQDIAIRIWKRLGVLEVEVRGIPPKRHFKVKKDDLFKLISATFEDPDLLDSLNLFAE
jgi:hypothetical protein